MIYSDNASFIAKSTVPCDNFYFNLRRLSSLKGSAFCMFKTIFLV